MKRIILIAIAFSMYCAANAQTIKGINNNIEKNQINSQKSSNKILNRAEEERRNAYQTCFDSQHCDQTPLSDNFPHPIITLDRIATPTIKSFKAPSRYTPDLLQNSKNLPWDFTPVLQSNKHLPQQLDFQHGTSLINY